MIILDTDIITLLDAPTGPDFDNLVRRLSGPDVDRVCVTIVSYEEQMRGWLSYIAASRSLPREVEGYARLHRMLRWYQQQEILDFDARAAEIFLELKRARTKCGSMDLKIAAIARSHDVLLVSRNTRDFARVPELRVEDWTRPHNR